MKIVRSTLFVGSALGAVVFSTQAFAQSANSTQLEDVVVTATKQTDTVSRVPLTVNAVTQTNLDQQGIKTAADLVRVVPGLTTQAGGSAGGVQQTFSIRGLVGAANGAATTGVYLDDTSLTKRSNGGTFQNNGVIIPLLYDLERVEVLKGPQGTLYGGSSMGGTVRFITPTPSLTKFTASGRAEVSAWDVGGSELSREFAGAVGGPIIKDKVGFRVSAVRRNTGGYIDAVSPFGGASIRKNANSLMSWGVRGSLLWQATDRASAQVSYYHSDNKSEGGPNSQTAIYLPNGEKAPAGQTFTTPAVCVGSTTRPATAPLAQPGLGAASTFFPQNFVCGQQPAGFVTTYVRPSITYGPYTNRDNVTLQPGGSRQNVVGSTSYEDVVALTLNYDFENMNVRSITSYLYDRAAADSAGGEQWTGSSPSGAAGGGIAGQTTTINYGGCTAAAATGCRGFPLFALFPNNTGTSLAQNKRYGIEEELRFSSIGDHRLTWVAGLYFSNLKIHTLYHYHADPAGLDRAFQLLYGPTFSATALYGVVNDKGFQSYTEANMNDAEFAGFGEANFWLVRDRLRLTGGVRVSKVTLDYRQLAYGQLSGRLASSAGSLTEGKANASPVTPKVSLQWQITDRNMAYVTAAKGFRAGGVNPQVSQSICQIGLDQIGITAADVPPAFDPDSVWSYEAGGKFRLLDNRLQVNGSVYRIDWKNIQTGATIPTGCPYAPTVNAGAARSEGVDLQIAFRPVSALTLSASFAYTDARYLTDVVGIPATKTPTQPIKPNLVAGDTFAVPPIQASASAQYSFSLLSKWESYVRLDYQYQSRYHVGGLGTATGRFGTTSFSPLTRYSVARDQINLRASVRFSERLEVNGFVNNLLAAHSLIGSGGSSLGRTCASTSVDCATFSAFNPFVEQTFQQPRLFGMQVNVKY